MTGNYSKYAGDGQTWLQWADAAYSGARVLFHSGNPFHLFPAAILGHHALEMYLKAALIKQGHTVSKEDVWGHDLVMLGRKLAEEVPTFSSEIVEKLRIFNEYFNELRYPAGLVNVMGIGEGEGDLLDAIVASLRPYAEPDTAG